MTTHGTQSSFTNVPSPSIMYNNNRAMLECGLHSNNSVGYKEETDRPNQLQVSVSIERAEGNPSEQEAASGEDCNHEEDQQQLEKRKSRTSNELPPPSLPPKPTEVKHEATDDPMDKHDYDHLEPADTEHDEGNDEGNDENEYAELENPVTKTLDTPPKKPPRRSRSREHFYHTLESSDDSGLLRSANTSQGGSQLSGMNDYAEANGPREVSISSQLQELFDDPRYAMLFVDQEQQENTLKREVSRSRSTQSLVSIGIIPFSPTVPERRSLRAPHQMRLLAVNPQHIHHHH